MEKIAGRRKQPQSKIQDNVLRRFAGQCQRDMSLQITLTSRFGSPGACFVAALGVARLGGALHVFGLVVIVSSCYVAGRQEWHSKRLVKRSIEAARGPPPGSEARPRGSKSMKTKSAKKSAGGGALAGQLPLPLLAIGEFRRHVLFLFRPNARSSETSSRIRAAFIIATIRPARGRPMTLTEARDELTKIQDALIVWGVATEGLGICAILITGEIEDDGAGDEPAMNTRETGAWQSHNLIRMLEETIANIRDLPTGGLDPR